MYRPQTLDIPFLKMGHLPSQTVEFLAYSGAPHMPLWERRWGGIGSLFLTKIHAVLWNSDFFFSGNSSQEETWINISLQGGDWAIVYSAAIWDKLQFSSNEVIGLGTNCVMMIIQQWECVGMGAWHPFIYGAIMTLQKWLASPRLVSLNARKGISERLCNSASTTCDPAS